MSKKASCLTAIASALKKFVNFFIFCIFCLSSAIPLHSLPTNVHVKRGNVQFERQQKQLNIRASHNSIIEYEDFSINQFEAIRFIQPSKNARVLNRVIGNNPSHINGNLFANGQVFLINPAGIYLGKQAHIDVAAFYAATGNISDHDFLDNKLAFTDLSNQLINEGFIQAQLVHLLGKKVVNTGQIVAPEGMISLIAADKVLIGEQNGHVFLEYEKSSQDKNEGFIKQDGSLQAKEVFLGAADVYAISMSQNALIQANKVHLQANKGKIDLKGTIEANDSLTLSSNGKVYVDGKLISHQNLLIKAEDLELNGLLDVSQGQAKIEGSLFKPITLGKNKPGLSLNTQELERIHSKQLTIGGQDTPLIEVYELNPQALKKVKELDLIAQSEKGRIHLYNTHLDVDRAKLKANDKIVVHKDLNFSGQLLELIAGLDKQAKSGQVFIKNSLLAQGDLLLSAGHSVVLENPKTLQANKSLSLENLYIPQSLSDDKSPFHIQAKEKLTLKGENFFEEKRAFEPSITLEAGKQIVLELNSQLKANTGLELKSASLQLDGQVYAKNALLISSNEAIAIGEKADLNFSLNNQELSHIHTPDLEIQTSQKILFSGLDAKHISQIRAKADSITFENASLEFNQAELLAKNTLYLGLSKLHASQALLLQGQTVSLKGALSSPQIEVKGSHIFLENAQLKSQKGVSGGQIVIGGLAPNSSQAKLIDVDKNSKLDASATKNGHAGSILVNANKDLRFKGVAKASAEKKQGGFVELSAKKRLAFDGKVDVSSQESKTGLFYLDPEDVYITSTGSDDDQLPLISSLSNEDFVISSKALLASLKHADVLIEAQHNIYLQDSLVSDSNSDHTLTMYAEKNIIVDSKLQLNQDIVLKAKHDILIAQNLQTNASLSLQAKNVLSSKPEAISIKAKDLSIEAENVASQNAPFVVSFDHIKQLDAASIHLENQDSNTKANPKHMLVQKDATWAENQAQEKLIAKSDAWEEKADAYYKVKKEQIDSVKPENKGLASDQAKKAFKQKQRVLLGAGDRVALSFRYGKENKKPKKKPVMNVESYLKELSR